MLIVLYCIIYRFIIKYGRKKVSIVNFIIWAASNEHVFVKEQNVWIHIILHMSKLKVSFGHLFPTEIFYNIGIKHGFSCINLRQVPREVLKTEAEGRGFQHLPRDLANVNALKHHVRSLLLHKN